MKRKVILTLNVVDGNAAYCFPDILKSCIFPLTLKLHSAYFRGGVPPDKPLFFFSRESYNKSPLELNCLGMMVVHEFAFKEDSHEFNSGLSVPLVTFGQRMTVFVSEHSNGEGVLTHANGIIIVELEGELSNPQLV